METFSALMALSAGNSPVTGEFPAQGPVTRSFGVFLDLHLNKQFSKQSRRRWFVTPSRSLWRHCNDKLPVCYRHCGCWWPHTVCSHSVHKPRAPCYCTCSGQWKQYSIWGMVYIIALASTSKQTKWCRFAICNIPLKPGAFYQHGLT